MAQHIPLSTNQALHKPAERSRHSRLSLDQLFRVGTVLVLVIYSVVLLAIEWNHSQEFVRNYFTDIVGPDRFYAINTTLCVFLLGGTALLFLVCWQIAQHDAVPRSAQVFARSSIDRRRNPS